ncbi:hypothetical protein MHM88_07460 [Epibacterium sp. MM17-32]|uniref:hypothetical protein n=1 Tax=Epibacterium sp. MM17-32 TaxID=2917734 RepID=UPI001EF680C6|nr:hypothetical protein [Epibacterium sp. MM17-32]MCG7627636.1 hypothetical protein [Epibacterium sp. MM17-32]
MILELTIRQLDVGPLPAQEADRMAQLGYMQWLGALNGRASYHREAQHALDLAVPFAEVSPAVAAFCDLLRASLHMPPQPLTLTLPPRTRRGGAAARRSRRMPQ